ncbi:hypothetical protein VM98_24890 [Streptomyces rubellomurinus subsp. indigoferus]|nr:hypothetical protein VM98_24890 [Streptomyces rubellomurinus subsp. indigoferus]
MRVVIDLVPFGIGSILALLVITLVVIAISDWYHNTARARLRAWAKSSRREAHAAVAAAERQQERELEQAHLRLNQRLQAAHDSAADTRLAAPLFAAEVHHVQQEWRRQGGDAGA